MPSRQLFPAQHWRDRAEEARAIAEQLRAPAARLALLKIAEGYENLARRAETRDRSGQSGAAGEEKPI